MDIKRIEKYDSVFEVIENCCPELLKTVSDEMKHTLRGFDDYEPMVHYVVNDSLVLTADSINGDTTGEAVSLKDFFFEAVQFCADLI